MGNKSTTHARSPEASKVPGTGTLFSAQSFNVRSPTRIPGEPHALLLVVGEEALSLHRASDSALLRRWPYHNVICWGFTERAFMWRAFEQTAVLEPEVILPALDSAVKATESATSSFSKPPLTVGGVSISSICLGASTLPALSISGTLDTRYPAERSELETAEAAGAALECRAVETSEGARVEDAVMSAVRVLMGEMSTRGIDDPEFGILLSTIRMLGARGEGESAIVILRQMALTRGFNVRQAASILRIVDAFEQIEAAVILCGALLTPSSIPLLLEEAFENAVDRDNVASRWVINISASRACGSIEFIYIYRHMYMCIQAWHA